jgi:hypothetical protein
MKDSIQKVQELKGSCAANISELFPISISVDDIEEISVSPDEGPMQYIDGVISYQGAIYAFAIELGLPSMVILTSSAKGALTKAFPFLPKGTLKEDAKLKSLVFIAGAFSFLVVEGEETWSIGRVRA